MGDLSKHFSRAEFRCKCGKCGLDTVDAELLKLCEEVREFVGGPVGITSGHRCYSHNKRVGGATNSQHRWGRAADLSVADTEAVFTMLSRKYPSQYGIGCYPKQGFVHVDTRGGPPVRWRG